MKTRLYLVIAFTVTTIFFACKKIDDKHKDFIVVSGIQYPGKATSPKIHTGYNRVQISWLRGTDPKVTRAKIYWNNFTDSVAFAIPSDQDTIKYTIENLAEKFYSFTIKTYDKDDNVSVPVEVSGDVFGDRFRATLLNRPVTSTLLNKLNVLTFRFDTTTTTGSYVLGSEVEYINLSGALKVVRSKAKETTLHITDRKAGTECRYRTLHLADSLGLDIFYTPFQIADIGPDKTELTISAYSSYNSGDTPLGFSAPANLFDNNQNTRWLSLTTLSYPHYATIDLGAQRTIKTISLWRWTIAPTTAVPNPVPDERGPDVVKFQGSVDNITWTDLGGNVSFNRLTSSEQKFAIPGLPQIRYIKINAVSGPQKFVILGEFNASIL